MNKSKSNTNYNFDSNNTPFKTDFNKSFSIYDIVNQEQKPAEGLLFRGKYCGKSKIKLQDLN